MDEHLLEEMAPRVRRRPEVLKQRKAVGGAPVWDDETRVGCAAIVFMRGRCLDTFGKVTSSQGIRLYVSLWVCNLQTQRLLVSMIIAWICCRGHMGISLQSYPRLCAGHH